MARVHFNNILPSGVPPKDLSLSIPKFGSKLTAKLSQTTFLTLRLSNSVVKFRILGITLKFQIISGIEIFNNVTPN